MTYTPAELKPDVEYLPEPFSSFWSFIIFADSAGTTLIRNGCYTWIPAAARYKHPVP